MNNPTKHKIPSHRLRERPFVIKPYLFGDLAQMYYPDHNYQSALLHFREEMHLTRGMWKAMVAEGYHENTKTLTRAQVRTKCDSLVNREFVVK